MLTYLSIKKEPPKLVLIQLWGLLTYNFYWEVILKLGFEVYFQ